MTLGELIKSGRAAKSMSQSELARAAGVTVTAISHYENGKRTPRFGSAVKILAVLDIPVGDALRAMKEVRDEKE